MSWNSRWKRNNHRWSDACWIHGASSSACCCGVCCQKTHMKSWMTQTCCTPPNSWTIGSKTCPNSCAKTWSAPNATHPNDGGDGPCSSCYSGHSPCCDDCASSCDSCGHESLGPAGRDGSRSCWRTSILSETLTHPCPNAYGNASKTKMSCDRACDDSHGYRVYHACCHDASSACSCHDASSASDDRDEKNATDQRQTSRISPSCYATSSHMKSQSCAYPLSWR
jgi:hypothetical protein